jgi:hypothetical protein
MDVAALWRSLRTDPAKAPHIGAHQATAGEGITINVAQTCQVALPPRRNLIPEVSVTITSNRPGVAAQVTIGANLNSPDGIRVLRRLSARASSWPRSRKSAQDSSSYPPVGPFWASGLKPSGRTGHRTALR